MNKKINSKLNTKGLPKRQDTTRVLKEKEPVDILILQSPSLLHENENISLENTQIVNDVIWTIKNDLKLKEDINKFLKGQDENYESLSSKKPNELFNLIKEIHEKPEFKGKVFKANTKVSYADSLRYLANKIEKIIFDKSKD